MGLSGCCSGLHPETVSTAKTTWLGKVGTAVTLTLSNGTKELEGAKYVSFESCGGRSSGEFRQIADFSVPVMKLEPQSVTVFFSTDPQDATMLEDLSAEFRAGRMRITGHTARD
jgi:hypothetical protein